MSAVKIQYIGLPTDNYEVKLNLQLQGLFRNLNGKRVQIYTSSRVPYQKAAKKVLEKLKEENYSVGLLINSGLDKPLNGDGPIRFYQICTELLREQRECNIILVTDEETVKNIKEGFFNMNGATLKG